MNKYQFKNIRKIFVTGGLGNLESILDSIKSQVNVKEEDKDAVHPMEAERLARKKAKNAHASRLRNVEPHHFYDTPGFYPEDNISFTFSDTITSLSESQYTDSIIIVSGDCGFGFTGEKTIKDDIEKLNKIMGYNNVYVIFVRGNHDDPKYFDGNEINLSNVKAVPDYSIIETKSDVILCIGGAISSDRYWRIEQEKRINSDSLNRGIVKKLYWENEAPVLDKEKLNEIVSEYSKIDFVVTHTAPSFANPIEHLGIQEWEKTDKTLREDYGKERLVMDRVFEYLRDNDRKPLCWFYSHFNENLYDKRSNTLFRSIISSFSPLEMHKDYMFSLNGISPSKSSKKMKVVKNRPNGYEIEPFGANLAHELRGQNLHPFNELRGQNLHPFDLANVAVNDVEFADALVANDAEFANVADGDNIHVEDNGQ